MYSWFLVNVFSSNIAQGLTFEHVPTLNTDSFAIPLKIMEPNDYRWDGSTLDWY